MRWVVFLTSAAVLVAQEPRFDTQSRLVLVPVTVTDARGRMQEGLEARDFLVFDNGRPQKVTVDTLATGVAPIALIVVVQTSGISKPVMDKVEKIGAMILPLVTGERGCAGLLTFSERLTWVQDCTNNEDALAFAFHRIESGATKSGRLLDAVGEAIGRLRREQDSRRVLLLISESRDRSSQRTLDQIAMNAQAAGVIVYSATYSAWKTAFTSRSTNVQGTDLPKPVQERPGDIFGTVTGAPPRCNPNGCIDPPLPPPEQQVDILGGIGELLRLGKVNDTRALADATGGTTFPFTKLKGLEEAIQKLGVELHTQYILSFTPSDSSPGYHQLDVRVKSQDFHIRARPGYWSLQNR